MSSSINSYVHQTELQVANMWAVSDRKCNAIWLPSMYVFLCEHVFFILSYFIITINIALLSN